MPSANKMTTPVAVDLPVIQGRYAELDSFTVGFETFPEDVDPAPLFTGLPDDRCQCPHWGYVISGTLTFTFASGEESYHAGDAFYAPAGHAPKAAAGTEFLQFSPSEELEVSTAAIKANMQALQHA